MFCIFNIQKEIGKLLYNTTFYDFFNGKVIFEAIFAI